MSTKQKLMGVLALIAGVLMFYWGVSGLIDSEALRHARNIQKGECGHVHEATDCTHRHIPINIISFKHKLIACNNCGVVLYQPKSGVVMKWDDWDEFEFF